MAPVELRHLRYFVDVAETLSFTRAAQRLHTAQPSLSQQIRRLEAEVGVALFERTRHQVRLTPAGRTLLGEASEILRKVDAAVHLTARAALARAAQLSVGSFPAADIKILTRLRPVVAAHLPGVRLLIHSKYAVDPVGGLRDGALDVAFLRGPIDDVDIHVTELLREPLVVVLPAAHALARRRQIDPRALDDLPSITVGAARAPALYAAVTKFYQHARIRVRTVDEADHVLGYLHLVQAGVGFGLLPDYVCTFLPPGVVTRPLAARPVPSVGIVMATHGNPANRELAAFVALTQECFAGPGSRRG